MFGVLTEITPNGRINIEAVKFEGCPDRYGRYEVMRNSYETDDLIRQFEYEMRRRYEIPGFSRFLPDKTPEIKKVIFNDPATVVIWSDDSKTVVKCQPGDTYDAEKGLALCISKKFLGNKGNFNEVFKKWIPEEPIETISVKEIIENVSIEDMKEALNNYCGTRTGCSGCMFWALNCDNENLSEEEIKRQYEMLKNKEDLKHGKN